MLGIAFLIGGVALGVFWLIAHCVEMYYYELHHGGWDE